MLKKMFVIELPATPIFFFANLTQFYPEPFCFFQYENFFSAFYSYERKETAKPYRKLSDDLKELYQVGLRVIFIPVLMIQEERDSKQKKNDESNIRCVPSPTFNILFRSTISLIFSRRTVCSVMNC